MPRKTTKKEFIQLRVNLPYSRLFVLKFLVYVVHLTLCFFLQFNKFLKYFFLPFLAILYLIIPSFSSVLLGYIQSKIKHKCSLTCQALISKHFQFISIRSRFQRKVYPIPVYSLCYSDPFLIGMRDLAVNDRIRIGVAMTKGLRQGLKFTYGCF